MLKARLRIWNREVFGSRDLHIDNLVKEMNDLDQSICEGGGLEEVAKLKEVSVILAEYPPKGEYD